MNRSFLGNIFLGVNSDNTNRFSKALISGSIISEEGRDDDEPDDIEPYLGIMPIAKVKKPFLDDW